MKRLILLLLFPATLCAQSTQPFFPSIDDGELIGQLNTIPTAFSFLRIAPDARAGGMGDGSVALSNDANAMYWNPSRLAFNKTRFGFAGSYSPWLRAMVPDINHFYTAAYFKPDSASAVGISATYFSLGAINSGVGIATERAFQMATDIAYARKFRKNLSVGLTARYFRSASYPVYNTNAQGFGADVGLSWVGRQFDLGKWNGHLQAGLAITDIGPKVDYTGSINKDFLPTNLALAFGSEFQKNQKHFIALQVEVNKLLVPSPPIYAIDTNGNPVWVNGQYQIAYGKDPNRSAWEGMIGSFSDAPGGLKEELREIYGSAGVEYDYKHIVKARTGFFYEHETKGNRKYLTFGIGGRYKGVALDLSYLLPVNAQRSPLQHTFKLTLLVDWNSFRKQSATR